MEFKLTLEQIKQLSKWVKSLPKIDPTAAGAIGGMYTYSFIPTGLGTITVVKRIDGHEINLTDFDSW